MQDAQKPATFPELKKEVEDVNKKKRSAAEAEICKECDQVISKAAMKRLKQKIEQKKAEEKQRRNEKRLAAKAKKAEGKKSVPSTPESSATSSETEEKKD